MGRINLICRSRSCDILESLIISRHFRSHISTDERERSNVTLSIAPGEVFVAISARIAVKLFMVENRVWPRLCLYPNTGSGRNSALSYMFERVIEKHTIAPQEAVAAKG